MFCPKCGDEMIRKDGVWSCVAGENGFSEVVDRILSERFASHVPSVHRSETRKTVRISRISPKGGDSTIVYVDPYYCPGCGVILKKDMTCPDCGVSIRDLLYPLVELFPHRARDGSWK
jgi:hypothetical protein